MRAFVVLLCLSVPLSHAASWERDFLAARDAARKGKVADIARIEKRLHNHPLLPYLQYWRLELNLDATSPAEIREFVARNTDSPLSDQLRRDWLKRLGQAGDWEALLVDLPLVVSPDTVLNCYGLQGRVLREEPTAAKEAIALWHTARDLPEPCTPLFQQLADRKLLSAEDVWRRLRLAFGEGNLGVVRHVLGYLPETERLPSAELDIAANQPTRWLDERADRLDQRPRRELAFFALERLARENPEAAAEKLVALVPQLPVADARYALGRIALRAARAHHPLALEWFRAAGTELTDEQLAWKVRAALRRSAWADVIASVSAMTETAAAEPAWRFWYARALKAYGRTLQANVLLAALSKEMHFYGELALEELGTIAARPLVTYKAEPAEIEDIRHIPAVARALMLRQVGVPGDANTEWEWATRNFDDRRLIAAAALALNEDWVDRAIRTADRTRDVHDFELRYPAPYREKAQAEAKRTGLDEAWVFGLIRQESRFVSFARSSAGAQGLMQIMPSTARWIARQLGFKPRDAHAMNEPGKNLSYGTWYLKHVLDRLDKHPVLATAAYNAGPARARRWQAEQALEGAVYAESIPFPETREYVKKVMVNAVRYAARFGQPEARLKDRLGIVPARNRAAPVDNGSAEPAE